MMTSTNSVVSMKETLPKDDDSHEETNHHSSFHDPMKNVSKSSNNDSQTSSQQQNSPSIENNTQKNELAYILLEDTEVVLLSPVDDNMTGPFFKWEDVTMSNTPFDVPPTKQDKSIITTTPNLSNDTTTSTTQPGNAGKQPLESTNELFCNRCDLIFKSSKKRKEESTSSNDSSSLDIILHNDPRFNGTMSDCKRCHSSKCSKTSCCDQTTTTDNDTNSSSKKKKHEIRNRSDAALLVGAVFSSQEKSLIHLQKFQIIIHGIIQQQQQEDDVVVIHDDDNNTESLLKVGRYRSNILMTFSLPQVEMAKLKINSLTVCKHTTNNPSIPKSHRKRRASTGDMVLLHNDDDEEEEESVQNDEITMNKRNLRSNKKRRTFQCKKKIIPSRNRRSLDLQHNKKPFDIKKLSPYHNEIPPCAELVYTLLRSDWQQLETKMSSHEKVLGSDDKNYYKNDSQYKQESIIKGRKVTKLFPVELTLEELYERIQGAASHIVDVSTLKKNGEDSLYNIQLPEDVLISNIAPFLLAKSLDSFRCTCRYIHSCLKAVVPGMKLKLYLHQIKSLAWMRHRECRSFSEGEILNSFYSSKQNSSVLFKQSSYGHDLYLSTSAGAVLTLEDKHGIKGKNDTDKKSSTTKWQIDTRTGNILRCFQQYYENDEGSDSTISPAMWTRKIARGGLLCDDPGLGKTITVLSLILQTLGLTTSVHNGKKRTKSASKSSITNSRVDDDSIFEIYWKEGAASDSQKMDLNRLLAKMRKSDLDSSYFDRPVDPVNDYAPDYYEIIQNPICIKEISNKIHRGIYGGDFRMFCSDVNLIFHNAMIYNDEESDVYKAAERLEKKFSKIVKEFKSQSVTMAQRTCTRQIDSPIAAVLTQKAKQDLMNSLHPSGATLLVVPNTLLYHWEVNNILCSSYLHFALCY